MKEWWVFDKKYLVDEEDRILKRRGKGFLKAFPDKDGYLKYAFTTKYGTVNVFVHRFIWALYRGAIPHDKTVDHIDGDKLNNHIDNLQLLSAEANAIKGNAKHWIIISPDDKLYYVTNLAGFCRNKGIHAGHMAEVARGYRNQTQCKGWRCYCG